MFVCSGCPLETYLKHIYICLQLIFISTYIKFITEYLEYNYTSGLSIISNSKALKIHGLFTHTGHSQAT